MHSIRVRNVNHAFREAFYFMRAAGKMETSRNGKVLVLDEPFATTYTRPQERVLFNPLRDANGVFHLMEAIWMMAGRNRVEWLLPFNKSFGQYAEDDGKAHGAYGARWWGLSDASGQPQLFGVLELLRKDPNTRRAVLQMWDSERDMGAAKRDLPCNTHIYFDCRGDQLNMTVCNRSNDMLWGAYGANAVHMSFLQEWMASYLHMPLGRYTQFSNNFHLYTDLPQVQAFLDTPPTRDYDFYQQGTTSALPLVGPGEDASMFLKDCQDMCSDGDGVLRTVFMSRVANPLRMAYLARKANQPYKDIVDRIPNCDWKLAFQQWCDRREEVQA